jgi:hypothetical protein
MRTLRLEIFWKVERIKRWWKHQSYADKLFLCMNSLFVFTIGVVPLICFLFGWEIK